MEGTKFYATLVPVSSARNEEEKMQIKMYNAALMGVIKMANGQDSKLPTMDDILDAATDSYISAATHVTSKEGSISYADRCGHSAGAEMFKKLSKKASMENRLDYMDGNGEWSVSKDVMSITDEFSASSSIDLEEELQEQALRSSIINKCFSELSAKDQILVSGRMAGKSGEVIAKELGCSLGAVHKRASDIKGRFEKSLSNSGYFDL